MPLIIEGLPARRVIYGRSRSRIEPLSLSDCEGTPSSALSRQIDPAKSILAGLNNSEVIFYSQHSRRARGRFWFRLGYRAALYVYHGSAEHISYCTARRVFNLINHSCAVTVHWLESILKLHSRLERFSRRARLSLHFGDNRSKTFRAIFFSFFFFALTFQRLTISRTVLHCITL